MSIVNIRNIAILAVSLALLAGCVITEQLSQQQSKTAQQDFTFADLEKLQGIKEGSGKPENTLYIFVDTRSPQSQKSYRESRPFIAKGKTIKWIPVITLGDTENGEQLAATLLQRGTADMLRRVLGNGEQIKTKPTDDTRRALESNIRAYKTVNATSVPEGFYLEEGKPVRINPTEKSNFEYVFMDSAQKAATTQAEVQAEIQKQIKQVKPGAIDGKWTGAIPDSIRKADTLYGVKEGSGKPEDTLYIIVDPRCPACRFVLKASRIHVAMGRTIKWIPIIALGQPEVGEKLAATILQRNSMDAVQRVLGNKEQIFSTPTQDIKKKLAYNGSYFEAAKSTAKIDGVPVAFYLDRQTGRVSTTYISQAGALDKVFGVLARK